MSSADRRFDLSQDDVDDFNLCFWVLCSVYGYPVISALAVVFAPALIAFITNVIGGILVFLVTVIAESIFLYKLWKVIPKDERRFKPGLAVGLCFVPILNIFWAFIVLFAVGKALDDQLKKDSDTHQRVKVIAFVFALSVPVYLFLKIIGGSLFYMWPLLIFIRVAALYRFRSAGIKLVERHLKKSA